MAEMVIIRDNKGMVSDLTVASEVAVAHLEGKFVTIQLKSGKEVKNIFMNEEVAQNYITQLYISIGGL